MTNEAVRFWLGSDKGTLGPVTWNRGAKGVLKLNPVEILGQPFVEILPELKGRVHPHGMHLRIIYRGRTCIVGLDMRGHEEGFVGPCSGKKLGTDPHLHRFDETCGDNTRREPLPPQILEALPDPKYTIRAWFEHLGINCDRIESPPEPRSYAYQRKLPTEEQP